MLKNHINIIIVSARLILLLNFVVRIEKFANGRSKSLFEFSYSYPPNDDKTAVSAISAPLKNQFQDSQIFIEGYPVVREKYQTLILDS